MRCILPGGGGGLARGGAAAVLSALMLAWHGVSPAQPAPSTDASAADESLTATDPASFEARTVALLPAYQPVQSVSGVIRIQGHGHVTLKWMERLLNLWEKSFQKFQPGITLEQHMKGTSSAIPALFTGMADIAILGEEIDPAAADAFQRRPCRTCGSQARSRADGVVGPASTPAPAAP